MQAYLAVLFYLLTQVVWSCWQPTPPELFSFFEGSAHWTEVESAKSDQLEKRNPIFLHIDFKLNKNNRIQWGSEEINGTEISMCWTSPEKKSLRITKGFFRTTLIKVKPGLLKSWIPFEGDLFYRKHSEVKRPIKKRGLAGESKS